MTDAMAPAFGKPQRLFIPRNGETVGISEVTQQDGRPVKPWSTTDQPPQPVLLQKVGAPILGDVLDAAVAQENVAILRRSDAGQTVERLIAGLQEPSRFACAVDGSQTMTGNAHQKPAVRMKCKPAGIALEGRKDSAIEVALARQTPYLAAAGDIERTIRTLDHVIGAGNRFADRAASIQPVIWTERAVHRGNRMLLPHREHDLLDVAPKISEEPHGLAFVTTLVAPVRLKPRPCRIGILQLDPPDTVVFQPAKIKVALVLAHRGQGGVIYPGRVPVGLQHVAGIGEFEDAAVVETRGHP